MTFRHILTSLLICTVSPLFPLIQTEAAPPTPPAQSAPTQQPAPTRPNILFILCDDLGYADLGCFGQKHFTTPHLDQLAADGMRLTQHYAGAPVCAPSRASILLGLHSGDCPVRDQQFDRPIPDTLTMASVLHEAGYRTLAIGKWGLGGLPEEGFPAHPQKRGFDAWYGLYTHNAGHVHYPDAQHPLFDGYRDITAEVANGYSTDLYTAKAKQWIADQTHTHPGQPFFLYLAYIAPHEAFNVPDGPYPAGGGLTGGVQMPLATHPEMKNKWIYPEFTHATYREGNKPANPELPWTEQMQRYATMVHRIDDAVADLRQTLLDLKIDKNTLIVFTSDNGPAYDDGLHATQFESWGPLDGFKRDLFEGGYREPTIVCQPGVVPANTVRAQPTAQFDWLDTFAQLAGVVPPAASDGISLVPLLTGQGTLTPRDALYFEYTGGTRRREDIGTLTRHKYTVPPTGDPWGQQQAVHVGDYVGIRAQIKDATTNLRLYNVTTDPHEDHDLAADPAQAGLIAQMNDLLITSRIPQAGNPRPYENTPFPAVAETSNPIAGLSRRVYAGAWPWTPDVRYLTPMAVDRDTKLPALTAALHGKPGAVEWSGYLRVPTTGAYTFTVTGSKTAHLWLHDAHVLDSEDDRANPRRTERVFLAAGLHPIRILATSDGSASDTLQLTWTIPDRADAQPIPASAFSTVLH